ncbi:MAG: helix-turn-helix domain-containing protein [Symploca sp. SIO2C1]|nr:helix-turn-helix domain-containing protein [Symploca sp. SIO2C1]
MNRTRLLICGKPHRLVEIEFYYYNKAHPDPFAHRHPLQLTWGQWYFHRQGDNYRGGSFKGLDLTFGEDTAFGGILIRSLEAADGTLIDGPSLCVDHLLAQAEVSQVATLDEAIGDRMACDRNSPLVLEEATLKQHQIFDSARVGLSLKRTHIYPNMPQYLLRPYRYLTEPQRIRKGKPYLVLALHLQGVSQQIIHQLTGCSRKTIERYILDFEMGCQQKDLASYFGRDLKSRDLCLLHGMLGKFRI